MSPTMYDSIDVMSLPSGADAYAGYDDGRWPDAAAIAQLFAGKPVVRITVFPSDNEGDCLDVETGDATPQDAPMWVAARRVAGHSWPTVYCSESLWPTVRAAFVAQGVAQPCYWIASYPGPGAVVQPGAVAHQWIDHGGYDESVTIPGWPPRPAPPPNYPPTEDEDMPFYTTNKAGTGYVVATDLSSKTGVVDGADAGLLLATGLYHVIQLTDAQINAIPNAH